MKKQINAAGRILRHLGIFALLSWTSLAGLAAQTDFYAMLKAIDDRSNFDATDVSMNIDMTTRDPQKGDSNRKVSLFRRDRDDKFLMLTLSPDTLKGQGHLHIDDNLWVYDPVSRRFSHSTVKENYGDTVAKNADFKKSNRAIDYEITGSTSGQLGKYEVWILDLKARNDEVAFPVERLWIAKQDSLLLKIEDYGLGGSLLRTVYYPSYSKIGTRLFPGIQIFEDAIVKGKKTQLSYSNLSVSALPDDLFTKSRLERFNR